MRESVPTARYSPVCNVLRQWKTSLILTYRVYRLYDKKTLFGGYNLLSSSNSSYNISRKYHHCTLTHTMGEGPTLSLSTTMAEGPTTSFSTTMAEGPAPSTSASILRRSLALAPIYGLRRMFPGSTLLPRNNMTYDL